MSDWRSWVRGALVALAALAVVLSFIPAWQTDHWWVRIWDYPRLQIAAVLLLLLLLLLWVALKRTWPFWALVLGTVVALGWQLSHFIAYLPPHPLQVAQAANCPPGRSISLINANVLQTNHDYASVLRLVRARRPDVLLLLETSPRWAKAMRPLARDYPFRLVQPVPTTYGMMLLSKLPMRGEIRNLLQPGVPSAWAQVRLRGGQWVDLYALHPEPPIPGDDSGERDAELLTVGRHVRHQGRAAMVMGDLNDVAWSHNSRLFKKVAGMGDPRVGRGFYPTFNANYPLLRWPLDHLFVSPHFQVSEIHRLPEIHSDHFPMEFKLCLVDDPAERQVSARPSAATQAEASEQIGAGKAEHREETNAR
jgi:endonuclease/exonuclease/phosphatase (EEP) superfamily protein YafD